MQSNYPGFLIRVEIHNKERLAMFMQSLFRGYLTRTRFTALSMRQKECLSVCSIQNAWRGHYARVEHTMKILAATVIQSYGRRLINQKLCKRARSGIIKMQSCIRGAIMRH